MGEDRLVSQVDGLLIRDSGPWIRKKYYYLSRYLEIFTRGMHKKWRLTFIDLFAGPGRCLVEATKEEVDGSALQALQQNFTKYIFIEQDQSCYEALSARCKKSPKYNQIILLNGDCNLITGQIINVLDHDSLNLVFADPTRINIHFDTLKRLTSERRADLLLNIQFGMDIKRNFARYKREGDTSPLGLFLGGGVNWEKIKEPRDAVKMFKERIAGLGYSTVEFKDIEVSNTKNVPMYFLFFASKNPRGLDFWNKITEKDHSGQYEFL